MPLHSFQLPLFLILSPNSIVLLHCFKLGSNMITVSESENPQRINSYNPEPVPQLQQQQQPQTTQIPQQNKKYNPEDFSTLKLKVEQLYGSRWAIEQKNTIDVYHAIEIEDISLLKKDDLTLRIEFNLRQLWVADGLKFPEGLFKADDSPSAFLTAYEDVLANMWSPDSYIATSRESNMNTIGTPLSLVYIYKNTTIIFKVRMFTKVACSSNFKWYPLDKQTCTLVIESYKHHDNIARYHWTNESLYRPVVINRQRLFQYDLVLPLEYDSGIKTKGGRGKKYAFVRVRFRFERKLGNNIIQVYTPTVLVVILSWFSFWLGLDAIPGRVSLLITCMLTLVTMHSGMKGSIPPVHYVTMMDVWYVCCMAFVFMAICEFVIVKYIHWRQELKNRAEEKRFKEETRTRLYSIIRKRSAGDWQDDYDRDGSIQAELSSLRSSSGKSGKVKEINSNGKTVLPFTIVSNKPPSASANWISSRGSRRSRRKSTKKMPSRILQNIVMNAIGDVFGGEVNEKDNKDNDEENGDVGLGDDKKDDADAKKSKRSDNLWVSVDRLCRGIFPLLFCIFNGIYWPVLFYGSDEYEN